MSVAVATSWDWPSETTGACTGLTPDNLHYAKNTSFECVCWIQEYEAGAKFACQFALTILCNTYFSFPDYLMVNIMCCREYDNMVSTICDYESTLQQVNIYIKTRT